MTNFLFEIVFLGFCVFSIVLILFSYFFKNEIKIIIKEIDYASVRIVRITGIILILIWVYNNIEIAENEYEKYALFNRMFGPYAFTFWAYIGTQILFTQLLWFKWFRDNNIVRIIIAISLLVVTNFERYVILVTSFNRDFIPSSWTITGYGLTGLFLVDCIIKIVLYAGLVGIVYFGHKFIAVRLSERQ